MTGQAYEDLLGALQVAVTRDHRRRRRNVHAVLVVCLLVFLIGGTVSAATITPWWVRSKPERSKATVLVRATLRYDNNGLAAGSEIALWRAPDQAGGTCLLFGAARAGVPHRAGLCESNARKPVYAPGKPINAISSSSLSHGVYDHIIAGSVDPRSGIVKVTLERQNGSRALTFSHGWFLGDAAPTTTVDVPNAYVAGYDKLGHEVTRIPVWHH